jgi:prevent-host-death family protein
MSATLQITIRQLHARTGHFVRKAAEFPIIVTDNGKPVAEITPTGKDRLKKDEVPYFARRKLRPGFKKLMESGALKPKPGQKTIDEILDEVRADSRA